MSSAAAAASGESMSRRTTTSNKEPFAPFLRMLSSKEGKETLARRIPTVDRSVSEMKLAYFKAEKWQIDLKDELSKLTAIADDFLDDPQDSTKKNLPQEIEEGFARIEQNLQPNLLLQLPDLPSNDPRSREKGKENKGEEGEETKDPVRQLLEEKLGPKILKSPAISELQVSYDNLDSQLRLCLLYFSILPENVEIKNRILIHWWIGDRLVTTNEAGDECFKNLFASGLIQPVHREHSTIARHCIMHPWVRWMLVSVANNLKFFHFNPQGCPTDDSTICRRACLFTSDRQKTIVFRPEAKNSEDLLSLFNVNGHYLRFEKDKLSKYKAITILHLGRWQNNAEHHIEVDDTEFLEGLGNLTHLRYLSFRGISRITNLPESFGNLRNLQILDLCACHNLEALSAGITSLKRLVHLDVSECYFLEQMPEGLGSLLNLQVLKGFVIGNARSKNPCEVSELSDMKKLRKLSINIGSEAQVHREGIIDLSGLLSLQSLTLTWRILNSSPTTDPSSQPTPTPTPSSSQISIPPAVRSESFKMSPVLTNIKLPENLEKLDLRCFPLSTTPNWLEEGRLHSLKKLYLRGGMLSSLKINISNHVECLRLKFLKKFQCEWSKLEEEFECLTCVEIHDCPLINCLQPPLVRVSLQPPLVRVYLKENGMWRRRG